MIESTMPQTPLPDERTASSRIELLTRAEATTTSLRMLSRTTHFLASFVAIAGFAACSTTYSDVYSFKKNNFKAPPVPKKEIAAPTPVVDPFATAPGTIPGADATNAIPGVTPAPSIPGVDPAAAPGTTPAPAPAPVTPGAAPIPNL
jgi:hypothetical protein